MHTVLDKIMIVQQSAIFNLLLNMLIKCFCDNVCVFLFCHVCLSIAGMAQVTIMFEYTKGKSLYENG